MIALAMRLPPGLLRDVAELLPACVTTARRVRGDPAVPRRAKIALLIAIVWGAVTDRPTARDRPLDDDVTVVLLLRNAARAVPRELLFTA